MCGRRRIVSAAVDIEVADGDIAEHLLEEMDEIVTRGETGEVRLETLTRRRPVEAVKVRVVEEIALDPPGIVIHLPPFFARIDVRLELRNA